MSSRSSWYQALPGGIAESVREASADGFSAADRGMNELIQTFAMMVHEQNMDTHNVFGVRRELFPDFARFCLAWHVYAYFNTPRIRPSAQNQRPAVDVVFLGGPFVFRREQIVARFLTLYHDLVELPLAYTTREPHDGEAHAANY